MNNRNPVLDAATMIRKIMNNRNPVYMKGTDHRIVSVPNGLWQYQRRIAEKGTRECDNWEARSHPTSYEEALGQAAAAASRRDQ